MVDGKASEASDLTGLIERVTDTPCMKTFIANGVPVSLHAVHLRPDERDTIVLALRVLRVLRRIKELGSSLWFYALDDAGMPVFAEPSLPCGEPEFRPLNAAERLLGIGGEE